tara:strand:+ start:102 stop:494 length:393 start_codon:yes stop_codon:yes gene_type:complete
MFTREKAKELSKVVEEEVSKILKERGIEVKSAGGTFSELEYTMKLKLSTTNQNGEDQYAADFKRFGKGYGLKEEMLNSVIELGRGKFMKITGLDMGRRKNVVHLEAVKTGKKFLTDIDTATRAYDRAVAK